MPHSHPLSVIRPHFPALSRVQGGHPVAYFDGPGGTQVPTPVVRTVSDYLLHHNANTHWVYPTSVETDAMLTGARHAFADWFGSAAGEVAFGANMTTLTFHLARALSRRWAPGDEIVVTELDHHANVDPWRAAAAERGVTVRTVRLDTERFEHDWADFERVVTPKTRLVAVGAASNALGTITDVRRAAGLARAVGALVFVDAVHYAPHRQIDVTAFDCDFLACSAYKFCGPHVGILYGRRGLLAELDVPKLAPAPNGPPERLETGTQNHEGIAGAAAAVDFYASWAEGGDRRERLTRAFAALEAYEAGLVRRLWDGLGALPRVTRYGPPPERPRTATVSFAVSAISSEAVCRRLAEAGLFVSNGDFYATTAVGRLGHAEDGLIRVGCAPYTSAGEVDRLLDAVASVARD